MNYYKKKYIPIFKADQKICIGRANHDEYLEVDYDDHSVSLLDHILHNGVTGEEITKEQLYWQLKSKGMLVDEDTYNNNLNRNQLFFQLLGIPFPAPETLNSKILILGSGAGGSTIAYLLAQFGFKKITVVDDDTVEDSDINKTMVFSTDDLGKSKVVSLKKILKKNFNIDMNAVVKKVYSESEITGIIEREGPKLVIKACDPDLGFRVHLNKVCFKYRVPFIHMAYSFTSVNVGPFYVPGKTCCDESVNNLMMDLYGQHFEFSRHRRMYTDKVIHPSISFNINILANLILREIIFYFADRLEYVHSLGKLTHFFPLEMSGHTYSLECDPGCPVCGPYFHSGKEIHQE